MPEHVVDWAAVVARIQRGESAAEEHLYRTLDGGARFFLQRRLGTQDVDDRLHDVFLTVTRAIRRGEIDHPERLMGYVRTVLFRQTRVRGHAAADFDTAAEIPSPATTPEEGAIAAEKSALMAATLREMSDRDFEVLSRFYLREQPPAQICAEMRMTQTQFQLLKSRAKARLAELVRRKLARAS